jgi:hypothetical protein
LQFDADLPKGPTGMKLRESNIADELQVPRTRIRKAFSILDRIRKARASGHACGLAIAGKRAEQPVSDRGSAVRAYHRDG